jgi:exosortase
MRAVQTTGEIRAAPRRAPGWLHVGLIAILIALVFRQTFPVLWRVWTDNPSYSHGVLIPAVVAVLLWRKRRELRATALRPSRLGLPVVALGLLVHVAGVRGDVMILQGDGLIVVLMGLVLHFAGWGWFRLALFPLAYLVFMLPFLPIFQDEVSFRLKQVAASGAVTVSGWLGVLTRKDGMSIFLPSGALRIENACSGMQSLISLMALGALVAYLAKGPVARRVVLFLAAIPIALLVNVVRISALCVVGSAAGISVATGAFHDASGFVLFGVGFLMLYAVKRVLAC